MSFIILQGYSDTPFTDAVLHHLDENKKGHVVHTVRNDSETMHIASRIILGIKENKNKTTTKADL